MILTSFLLLLIQGPVAKAGLLAKTESMTPGFVLVAPLKSKSTFLVDKESGRVAHTWDSNRPPGNSVYLLENGDLWRTTAVGDNEVFRGGGAGGGLQRIAWDGTLLWELDWSDDVRLSHHDMEPLPNGNLLLISWEYKSPEEAFEAGRDPAGISEDGLWPDYVVELKPILGEGAGAVEKVWEWHAWDHLIQERVETKANFGSIADSPGRIDLNADLISQSAVEISREKELEEEMEGLGYIGDDGVDESEEGPAEKGIPAPGNPRERKPGGDWLHTNGVDYDPARDLIVLSSRVMSEVWIIDHSTTTKQAASGSGGRFGKGGDILWRWGNPRNYGAGDLGDQKLFKQHDPSFIGLGSPGAGNLLIYNNGEGRPDGNYSTVIELALPLNEGGNEFPRFRDDFGPMEPVWSSGAPKGSDELFFFSSFLSGAQRLPSGNTLICVGAAGRVLEVTPAGELAWEYVCPFKGLIPSAEDKRPGQRPAPGSHPGPPGGGPPRRGPGEEGGPPGGRPKVELENALFRATHLEPDHPGLSKL